MTEEIAIQGCISSADGQPIDQETFEERFYEWLERYGLRFGGGINPVTDEDIL
jgi:hypothetical protein